MYIRTVGSELLFIFVKDCFLAGLGRNQVCGAYFVVAKYLTYAIFWPKFVRNSQYLVKELSQKLLSKKSRSRESKIANFETK